MSRLRTAIRAFAAAVVLAFVVVGIPVVLVRTVGNPWPGRDALDLRDETAIVAGLLAALTWLVWARFTVLLGVEAAQQLRWIGEIRAANRDRAFGERPVIVEPMPAPRDGLGVLAQRLIATVLILIPLMTKSPKPSEAAPPLPITAPADPTEVLPETSPASSLEPRSTVAANSGEGARAVDVVEITIGPNETLRSIAREHLGDAGRWREVFELNAGRVQVDGRRLTSPSALHVGWRLHLPADAIVHARAEARSGQPARAAEYVVQPGDAPWNVAEALVGDGSRHQEVLDAHIGVEVARGVVWTADDTVIYPGFTFRWPAEPARAFGASREAPSLPETTIIVQPGDTLWELAEDRLATTGGLDDTVDYVGQIVAANHVVIEDPNLIFPGERVTMPSIGIVPETPPQDPSDHRPPDKSDGRPAPHEDRPSGNGDRARPPVGRSEPDATPATDPATPSTSTSTSTSTTATTDVAAPAPEAPAPVDADTSRPSNAPVGLGLVALSAGVLAVLEAQRRRRLRAARVRQRIAPSRPQEVIDVERQLRHVDGVERSARLDVAVRAAAASMLHTGHRLIAATVDPQGAVSLLLDGPVSLPGPWIDTTGAGRNWRIAARVEVEALAAAARQVTAPCAALVPIGATAGGAEVHVDLECLGTLAVDAERATADQIVAGIAAGLAGSALAEAAHLIGVGVSTSAFLGHPNHHDVETVDEAVELAGDLLGSPVRSDSTFQLRARHTGGESWEPAVIFVGGGREDERDDVLDAPRLAYVVAGPGSPGDARLAAGSDTWRLEPYGIELTPVGLTAQELLQIDELLLHERCPHVAVSELNGEVEPQSNGEVVVADDGDVTPGRVPCWDLVVRLFGLVDVVNESGNAASFAKSKSLELLAWAATHRERSTRQGARAALWDVDVRDATFANVVSEARRVIARLCEPPAGEEWLARTMNASLLLHERVVTDADLMAARLELARRQQHADAVDTLRGAVELIRGVPFAESGYLWPDAEGITSQLVVLATSCCTELAELLLDDGDVEGVFSATGQGLKVLPGHEELIGYRMRAHALNGDRAAVRQEWEAYERVLLADPWSDGEPAPSLITLRQQLLSPPAPAPD